jgi:hypothetical protein
MAFSRIPATFEGGHKVGELEIAPWKLVLAFGPPEDLSGDGKVSGEYTFRCPDGSQLTVYDWKSTSDYDRGLPTPHAFWRTTTPRPFSIGGHTAEHVPALVAWLRERA